MQCLYVVGTTTACLLRSCPPTGLHLRAHLHESQDEFRPGMIKFLFYVSVLSWDPGTKVVPPELNLSRPCLTNTVHTWNFHPGKTVYMTFFATFHPGAYERDEIIPGGNCVNSNKKTTRYQDEFIPGRKSSQDKKIS